MIQMEVIKWYKAFTNNIFLNHRMSLSSVLLKCPTSPWIPPHPVPWVMVLALTPFRLPHPPHLRQIVK